MNIQMLLIKPSLVEAVALKQALEQTRHFTVIPFTDVTAALEFLRSAKMDLVLIDLESNDYDGLATVQQVLELNYPIHIMVSTSDSQLAAQALSAGAVGLLDAHYTARQVMTVLSQIEGYDLGEDTRPMQPTQPIDLFDKPIPEGVLATESEITEAVDDEKFNKLLAEEPPLPDFESSGTVTDFIAITRGQLETIEDPTDRTYYPSEIIEDDETEADTPAQFILENTDTIPLEDDPFKDYLKRLRNYNQDDETYVREPDFLPEDSFFEDDPFLQNTELSSSSELPVEPETLETETLQEVPIQDDDTPSVSPFVDVVEVEEQPEETELQQPEEPLPIEEESEPLAIPEEPVVADVPAPMPTLDSDFELHWEAVNPTEEQTDPRIIQMAVSLTQASLESTAEAVFITNGQQVIASEGMVSDDDMQEFLKVVTNNSDVIPEGQSRLRYVTLQSNGLDYLVYSRQTHDEYVLSMVFGGQVALRDIRQQAKKLAVALTKIPEPSAIEPIVDEQDEDVKPRGGLRLEPPAPEDINFEMYTFVWLLRDSYKALEHSTAEAINSGLRVQLFENGYHVGAVDVEDDYVYVLAGIPTDESPQEFVRELQKRAAQIAHAHDARLKPEQIWANSYFILSPGRELNVQEIQQYINFYRM